MCCSRPPQSDRLETPPSLLPSPSLHSHTHAHPQVGWAGPVKTLHRGNFPAGEWRRYTLPAATAAPRNFVRVWPDWSARGAKSKLFLQYRRRAGFDAGLTAQGAFADRVIVYSAPAGDPQPYTSWEAGVAAGEQWREARLGSGLVLRVPRLEDGGAAAVVDVCRAGGTTESACGDGLDNDCGEAQREGGGEGIEGERGPPPCSPGPPLHTSSAHDCLPLPPAPLATIRKTAGSTATTPTAPAAAAAAAAAACQAAAEALCQAAVGQAAAAAARIRMAAAAAARTRLATPVGASEGTAWWGACTHTPLAHSAPSTRSKRTLFIFQIYID